jgi:hypothetical protein
VVHGTQLSLCTRGLLSLQNLCLASFSCPSTSEHRPKLISSEKYLWETINKPPYPHSINPPYWFSSLQLYLNLPLHLFASSVSPLKWTLHEDENFQVLLQSLNLGQLLRNTKHLIGISLINEYSECSETSI